MDGIDKILAHFHFEVLFNFHIPSELSQSWVNAQLLYVGLEITCSKHRSPSVL